MKKILKVKCKNTKLRCVDTGNNFRHVRLGVHVHLHMVLKRNAMSKTPFQRTFRVWKILEPYTVIIKQEYAKILKSMAHANSVIAVVLLTATISLEGLLTLYLYCHKMPKYIVQADSGLQDSLGVINRYNFLK